MGDSDFVRNRKLLIDWEMQTDFEVLSGVGGKYHQIHQKQPRLFIWGAWPPHHWECQHHVLNHHQWWPQESLHFSAQQRWFAIQSHPLALQQSSLFLCTPLLAQPECQFAQNSTFKPIVEEHQSELCEVATLPPSGWAHLCGNKVCALRSRGKGSERIAKNGIINGGLESRKRRTRTSQNRRWK